ncbi:putative lipoprotein [Leptospira interrogans str. 2003000735]|uniref:hypothetical protein n=1 Tax=Leptospira interrogans TaxID=173 RepID=UPI000297DA9D|nr:hypothetical protein [Leptospira interrogans]EKQ40247.1 putative lipoprotein [Leptospira interrogans str. 2002000621]EMJ68654.1 putative lipoprotein [Leptospira interrogans str. 2003000735]EMJ69037.1 putative lipoprotein [Leptospira interrogans str. 2003000735]EMJ70847.1 putative lipoprotein [Leptospira interrogans str. 2003000735]EMJ72787.1 putative lipoprotein [Leptospira interrogans str. 2002000632]
MKFKMWSCLLLVLMTLTACQSQANRARSDRNEACRGSFRSTNFTLTKPPETSRPVAKQIEGDWYVTSSRYNAYRIHAKDLARCLEHEQCVRSWTEWERNCADDRIDILESSWIPGVFHIRRKCELTKPICLVEE